MLYIEIYSTTTVGISLSSQVPRYLKAVIMNTANVSLAATSELVLGRRADLFREELTLANVMYCNYSPQRSTCLTFIG